MPFRPSLSIVCFIVTTALLAGCADTATDEQSASETAPQQDSKGSAPANGSTATDSNEDYEIGSLDFTKPSTTQEVTGSPTAAVSSEQALQMVMEQLRPLQGLLGSWRGTTRREFGEFKAVDAHEWVWDLQSEPDQPALELKSDESPYVRSARMTWDVKAQQFLLKTIDGEGQERQFTGTFDQPVKEIVGDDNKLHKTFRLLFTQTEESAAQFGGEQWQLAWNAQDSNRYLLELDRRRGKARFRRYDTVSTQREGTSFAVSDSDYGEKTCIISQGLGTIAVSYKGRSYWVCCTGCKAAFEADPETWIARAEKAAKDQ